MPKIGRIVQKSSDREIPRQKRRRKDLDRIHSKILKAKKELDNVGKNDNKGRQRKPNHAKISTRLLPEPAVGIYRNGAKGKDVKKAETSTSTFESARLKADALKLFNGDTSEFKYREELSTHNETTKHSPNKSFVKNSLNWTQGTMEQSPILGEKLSTNQKSYLVKKKSKKNFFKNFDSDKIRKQNDEPKYVLIQKENIYKQKLLQNDKEQSKDITVTQMQTFDNGDYMKENENRTQQILENKNPSRELNRYVELCKTVSAINFGEDFQNYQPDPLTTTIAKLKHAYSKSQQCAREKHKRESKAVKSSVEYQTYSDISPNSTSVIEYEVPNNSENNKQNEEDNIYSMQSDNIAHYSSTSCSSQNTLTVYDTDGCIIENRKNNDNSKQSAGVHPTKATSFSFVTKKDSIQKDFSYIDHSSKNKRHDKDNFYLDFPENVQCIDNTKHAETSTFLNDSMLLAKKYSSKDYACEEVISNRITNKYNAKNIKQPVIRRYNNITAKRNCPVQRSDENSLYNKAYMERLYKEFDIDINNKSPDSEKYAYADSFNQQFLREKNKRELETVKSPDLSVEYQACTYSDASQVSSNSISTFKVDEIPKYNRNHILEFPFRKDVSRREDKFHLTQSNVASYNDVTKESCKMQFPNASKNNFPTPSIINEHFVNNVHDRIETFEPQIESMEMKDSQDSQESLINQFDINMYPNRLDGKNKLCQFDDSLQTLEAPYNTNLYAERLIRERVMPLKKRHLYHSRNYHHHANYLGGPSSCNFNIQSTKSLPQQTKLYICESNDEKQEFFKESSRNQNILFNSSRTIPSLTLNLAQSDKRSREPTCEKIFNKADVECSRNQANSYHCDKQYIHLDSTNCQHKYNVSQAHHFHEGAVQPRILQVKGHNSSADNCINLSNDVPSLLLEQKHITYPKVHDDHQHRAVLLQNVTQPIKYFAVNNNSNIQRIPVYINDDRSIVESVPVKVITLVKSNAQSMEEPYFHKCNFQRK